MERSVGGVGVLDKAVAVLDALDGRPRSLAELTAATKLPRATAHRLAVALEQHGLVRRDDDGRFTLGLRLLGWGRAAGDAFPLSEAARPVLVALRDDTGESVQLFVRHGDTRVCVDSLESPHALRWIVPVGAVLPLDRGSAGRVLATTGAVAPRSSSRRVGPESVPIRGRGDAGKGWVASVEERERGVCSVSAPVRDGEGQVVAAVSVSGPIERLSRDPGHRHGAAVVRAARAVEAAAALRRP